MTTKEAAVLWGVTPATVRHYCASRRIKHCEKVKGKWLLNPLCHKPFDSRFKKPTIVLSSIIKKFSFNGNGDIIEEYFPLLLMPKNVYDGLAAEEAKEMLQVA